MREAITYASEPKMKKIYPKKNLFESYQAPANIYDEMFSKDKSPYIFTNQFVKNFNDLLLRDMKKADRLTRQFFLNEGITFNIYDKKNGEGERAFPVDIIPRIMSSKEWNFIEKGLSQRLRALNLFLKDIYTDEKILKDRVLPKDLIYESPHFLKEMKNSSVPFDIYVSLCGTDIVRTSQGLFVLEDNLRVPSGSSYMLTARQIMKQNFLRLFRKLNVLTIDDYCSRLLSALNSLSEKENPRVVLLTPGVFNSAYFEHAFLARQMGIELVQGQDLTLLDNKVYMKSVKGLKQVDVIYRRIDDVFLDPLTFRSDSLLGVPGLFSAYKSGSVVIANAPGTGVADDKAVYRYVQEIIKYYLDEDPILYNVQTYACRNKKEMDYTIENMDKLVVKPVGGSGGYDLIIGSMASRKEKEAYKEKIKHNPKNFISQPILDISISPCFIEGSAQARHVDLRPFICLGKDFQTDTVPGGLCRVALKDGSLIVNSSQGGGSKDMWVIK